MTTKLDNQGESEEFWNAAREASDQENETSDACEDRAVQPLPTEPIEAEASTNVDCDQLVLRQDSPEQQVGLVDAPEPPNKLTLSQLAGSVPGWLTKLDTVDGAVELYRRFAPANAAESILALLAVGLTNATMDGLERANRDGLDPAVRQIELKLAHNGSAAVVDVLKTLQSHRRVGDQKISVETVNIGPGAQAILGSVQAGHRKAQDEDK